MAGSFLAVGNFNLPLGMEYFFLDGTTWILNFVLTLMHATEYSINK
jgi:hypothetical protein